MELTADNVTEGVSSKKSKGGIKSFTFTSSGNNGESHRKNSKRKRAQHLKNVQTRAVLHQDRGRISSHEYHVRLTAISTGTA